MTPITSALGTISCSISICLAAIAGSLMLMPVRLPPGLLKLATRPAVTGSAPVANIIGMFVVAAFAASAAGRLNNAVAETLR